MQLTKAIFDLIKPGEIFRVVTTKIQAIQEPFKTELTFVCVKGKYEGVDWAIYAGHSGGMVWDIARYGVKVKEEDNIRNICPCDDEVFQLYRM